MRFGPKYSFFISLAGYEVQPEKWNLYSDSDLWLNLVVFFELQCRVCC